MFIALDLDGTLLDSHHKLSSNAISVLQSIASSGKGHIVSIASGRSKINIVQYLDLLSLDQKQVPVICYNGAYGVMYERSGDDNQFTPRTVFVDDLAEHQTQQLIQFAENNNYVVQYYDGDSGEVYSAPKTDEHVALLQRYEELVGRKQIYCESYAEIVKRCPRTAKLLILANDIEELLVKAKDQLDLSTFEVIRGSPFPFFVEFLTLNVNKGNAVVKLLQHLNISTEQLVAFGDGDNDKEMLQHAKYSFAMKNAKPVAKAAAKEVIQWSNDEDGVAKQLQTLLDSGVL